MLYAQFPFGIVDYKGLEVLQLSTYIIKVFTKGVPRVQKFAQNFTCSNFHGSYFAVLIFMFWSWVTKIAKIWTLRKFLLYDITTEEMV